MDLTQAIEDRRQSARHQAEAAFKKLIVKLAHGKLTSAEIDQLDQALITLNIPPADANLTLLKLKRHFANDAIISDGDKLRQAAIAAQAASDAFDRETVELIEKLKSERHPTAMKLITEAETTAGRKRELEAAEQENRDLNHELWQLLDLEDPAITSRRRHLYAVELGRDCPPAELPVLAFGAALESPGAFDFSDPTGWATLPGQSREQLDMMLDVLTAWTKRKIRRPRFLSDADAHRLAQEIRSTPNHEQPAFEPAAFVFIPHVDQTPDQLAELVNRLTRARNGHRWYARVEPMKVEYLTWPGCLKAPRSPETVLGPETSDRTIEMNRAVAG
jgi:hypothetical protein